MTKRTATTPAPAPQPSVSRLAQRPRLSRLLRTRMRSQTTILMSALVATPLLLTGTAELIARSLIHHRIENSAAKYFGSDVDIDISGLALVDLMTRHLNRVEISSDNLRLGKVSGASMKAQLNDVRFGGGSAGGSVISTHAEIQMSSDAILNMVKSSARQLPVTSVTPDQASGTLELGVGGGMARIDIRPDIQKGRVEFTVTGAEIMGRPASEARVDKLKDKLGNAGGAGSKQAYPLALKATSATVTNTGVRITLDGGPTDLKAR
ncbi:LmeA family phospholipid-binding protein [Actinacidiphila glaucinigra]|uniref:LmeA family phospholipid-binding protein n=1 Tax=Actinacidiphila glaucinigra TaxID=235986 RepID=UPI0037B153AE